MNKAAQKPIDESRLVHILLDIGEEMLLSGAEVFRVEDTVQRIGTAFGATRVNIFVITSSIILTLTDADGRDWTHTKRIEKPAGTDFARLGKLNHLSRVCCAEGMTLDEVEEKIRKIRRVSPGVRKHLRSFLGSALVGFAFTVFFGGTWIDGLLGAAGGLFVCLLQTLIERFFPNRIIFNLASGFLVGAVICFAVRFLPGMHEDKILIGDIMLQIPGIATTISFRDMISGETISGALRLIESLLWAAALACGYMLAILLVSGGGLA